MSDNPPFVDSEIQAARHLLKLRKEFSDVNLNNRNSKGEITSLDLIGVMKCDRDTIRAVGDLQALQNFTADAPYVCDLLFEMLGQLPCLERVTVWDEGRLTDTGVAHLANAQTLDDLDIRGSRITDNGLSAIGQLSNLTRLQITAASLITNNSLRHFGNLQKLHMLSISGPLIDDAGLIHLAQIKGLSFLSLMCTQVRGRGCVHLRDLKKLNYLLAHESLFDDDGLAALEGFPKLEHLGLRGTRVTDAGIPHLAQIPRLKDADFTDCRSITDRATPAFARSGKLKTLYLERTSVTPAGRKALKAVLPKCTIFVSDATSVSESEAPWQDRNYFWKHPPACLSRFKLTKKRTPALSDWSTRFQLACPCGHRNGIVTGYPLSKFARTKKNSPDSELFVGPLSFCCEKCESATEIIDTEHDGYHGQLGASAVYRGKGTPALFRCPHCAGTLWQVQATVVMNEGAFDLWHDAPDIELENYFDEFLLHGTCAACKKTASISEFENLG